MPANTTTVNIQIQQHFSFFDFNVFPCVHIFVRRDTMCLSFWVVVNIKCMDEGILKKKKNRIEIQLTLYQWIWKMLNE